MRTETLAVVFTDIKGYTAATSTQTHQQNARMLRRIERIIAPVVRAYGGRVVKSIGDAYMIVFRSPTEAVRCAMAIQDRLHQHNSGVRPDAAIHIRIAMNVGEVRVHRGDVFGEPVNIAARIESITPADEIYLSEAVYLTMNRSDLPSERVGDFELKGIPEPITVYRGRKILPDDNADGRTVLPFGGTQLGHWRRMRWLRRATLALWVLVLAGLGGAAYLRYRPTADYTEIVVRAKAAVDERRAMDAISLAVQVPVDATQERSDARRVRLQAVALLMQAGNLEVATTELASLLNEDARDPEGLLLQGELLARRGKDLRGALSAIATALKINASLANRAEVASAVVQGYRDPAARRIAEQVVDAYLKQNAVAALSAALADDSIEYKGRVAIALRLEKLGAGPDVDWVNLALEQLKSTSCKSRKDAIQRLLAESDERAVGPLMKLAETNGCGAAQARKAAETILGK